MGWGKAGWVGYGGMRELMGYQFRYSDMPLYPDKQWHAIIYDFFVVIFNISKLRFFGYNCMPFYAV